MQNKTWLFTLPTSMMLAAVSYAGIPLPSAVLYGRVCVDGNFAVAPDPDDPNAVPVMVMACINCSAQFIDFFICI